MGAHTDSAVWQLYKQRVRVMDRFIAFTEDKLRNLIKRYSVPKLSLRKIPYVVVPSRANPSQLEQVYLFQLEDVEARKFGRDMVSESEFALELQSALLGHGGSEVRFAFG